MNYLAIVPASERERVLKLEAEWIEKQRANFWKGWVTPSGGMPLSPPGNNIGQTDLIRRTPPEGGAENPDPNHRTL